MSALTAIHRELPTDEARALLELTRDLARGELMPRADKAEEAGEFPLEMFTLLGDAGLLSLPYPQEFGGGGQPMAVYLQALEELARGWLAVALGVSVHVLACHGVVNYGTREQQERWLPDMLGGRTVGAFALSEPQGGSDVTMLRTTATRDSDQYRISGDKAWITHGSLADFFLVMARTGAPDSGSKGVSAFHVPAGVHGVAADRPERKMGLRSSPTTQLHFTDAAVPADHLLAAEGDGIKVAFSALDSGRLGMAACAVGVAQAAMEVAVGYAVERQSFGRAIIDHQGVGGMLADAAAGIAAARQLYLYAARRKDSGLPFSTQAAMAKLTATEMAMRVTTDMVQVLGGAGYVQDYPVERYMREAKVLQIVEGTNQIQRMVIARALAGGGDAGSTGGGQVDGAAGPA